MKKGPSLIDEEDLEKRRQNDNYHIEKVVKVTFLAGFISIFIFILIAFIYRCIIDKEFLYAVLDIVKMNLSGIIFFGISVLGLSKYLKD